MALPCQNSFASIGNPYWLSATGNNQNAISPFNIVDSAKTQRLVLDSSTPNVGAIAFGSILPSSVITSRIVMTPSNFSVSFPVASASPALFLSNNGNISTPGSFTINSPIIASSLVINKIGTSSAITNYGASALVYNQIAFDYLGNINFYNPNITAKVASNGIFTVSNSGFTNFSALGNTFLNFSNAGGSLGGISTSGTNLVLTSASGTPAILISSNADTTFTNLSASNFTVSNTLTVNTISGGLSGNTNFQNNIGSAGSATFCGNGSTVSGAPVFTVGVPGQNTLSTINGTLTISAYGSGLNCQNDAFVNNTLIVNGITTISNALNVTGNTSLGSLNGTVTLGSATSGVTAVSDFGVGRLLSLAPPYISNDGTNGCLQIGIVFIQWGLTGNASGGTCTANFSQNFGSGVYCILGVCNGGSNEQVVVSINRVSVGQATFAIRTLSATAGDGAVFYIAIGAPPTRP